VDYLPNNKKQLYSFWKGCFELLLGRYFFSAKVSVLQLEGAFKLSSFQPMSLAAVRRDLIANKEFVDANDLATLMSQLHLEAPEKLAQPSFFQRFFIQPFLRTEEKSCEKESGEVISVAQFRRIFDSFTDQMTDYFSRLKFNFADENELDRYLSAQLAPFNKDCELAKQVYIRLKRLFRVSDIERQGKSLSFLV